MIAYLDSSVLLRLILGQANRLSEWAAVEKGVASSLVEVECLRTLDRLRLKADLSAEDLATRRETVFRLTDEMTLVEPTPAVLRRASQPLPTALGTSDAIHLATARLWAETSGELLVMATHDGALALAARAFGIRVVGS